MKLKTQKPIRALSGWTVGLSISYAEEASARGFSNGEINRTVLRFVSAILGQGAGVCFGHDWRGDGVMEAVHGYVERFRSIHNDPPASTRLWNFVPWPDKLFLTKSQRDNLAPTLRIEQVSLPSALNAEMRNRKISRAYLRARALTQLRRVLSGSSGASVCLGGKVTNYEGRFPGILEEAFFSIRANKPIYLVGMFGGATRQLILATKGKEDRSQVSSNDKMISLYKKMANVEAGSPYPEDFNCSVDRIWSAFNRLGVSGLSRLNGLSVAENVRLYETEVVEEAIDLVLKGLGNCRR